MDWTNCPVIEQVPGRMSGALVVRGTRIRAQDIIAGYDLGAAEIAASFCLSLRDVEAVLSFWEQHAAGLPMEYFSPEWIEAHGADIDWTGCAEVTRTPGMLSGEPTVQGTNVRPVDLIGNRNQGEDWLVQSYELPVETIRSVLGYYDRHKRQLAPAA